MRLLIHRLQHPIHDLAVPAGAEHLLGDDGFIERVLLDDAPEMAEDADIVVKMIQHFGSHGFAPFLGGFFAGVNVVELLAEIIDSTADTGEFVFVGVRISRLFRNLYMEQQMLKQIAIDKPILFLILKRIPRGILVIAEHDCLIFIDMMAEETFSGARNQLVLGTIENANVIG